MFEVKLDKANDKKFFEKFYHYFVDVNYSMFNMYRGLFKERL